ncbi:MAG: type II toxin-antitoxin system prevent-host-death family antitoxin [Deltaproteobacteria bacterium]
MIRINTQEAKTRLSYLLAAVEERDETVVICRAGRPVAELRRFSTHTDPLQPHPVLGQVVFLEDPVQPLDSDDWQELL